MSNRLSVSFGSDYQLYEEAEDLLDDVDADGKSASARELFRAAIEAAENTDKSPCEAIVEGTDGEDLDYHYSDRRGSKLSADEVVEIVTSRDNPVINPTHVPTHIESEVTSTRRKVDICLAVLRYNTLDVVYRDTEKQENATEEGRYVGRSAAAVAVEQTIGTGRDDYYIDSGKADIPGRVLDRLAKIPYLKYNGVERSSDRSGRCAVELHKEFAAAVVSLSNVDVGDLSDRDLNGFVKDCNDLMDIIDQVAISAGDKEIVEQFERDLDTIRSRAVVEFNGRDIDTEDRWDDGW